VNIEKVGSASANAVLAASVERIADIKVRFIARLNAIERAIGRASRSAAVGLI
jgi:hypothetical protein